MSVDINAVRTAWERLDAACAGLLARQCKSHRPYMGCPLDCGDIENALDPEFAEARPLIAAVIDEVERLRLIADEERVASITTLWEQATADREKLTAELREAHDALTSTRLELAQMRGGKGES